MALNTTESFRIIIFMDLELTLGLMEEILKVNGKIIKWMVKVNLDGLVYFLFFVKKLN